VKIDDIVRCFFLVLHPKTVPSKKYVKQIYDESKDLLSQGWTIANITNRIVSCDINSIEGVQSLNDVPYLNSTPPLKKPNNLLEDKFYYNSRLHKISEPASLDISIEGKIIEKKEPFYLELVESFTAEDLVQHFYERLDIKDKDETLYDRNKKRINGYLKSYDLDLLLFTIDEIKRLGSVENWDTKVAESIIYYTKEGKKRMENVKNSSSGKVHPFYKAYLKKRGVNK
jgi:hypothetical protein